MRITFATIGLAALFWAGQVHAQALTFRGLGASSISADVRKEFPQARVQNYCNEGETLKRSGEGETLCAELAVENYVLDNVSFDLTFMFNPDGTLRYVLLTKTYGNFRSEEGGATVATINATFTSLADLLSSKYGPPVADAPRPTFGGPVEDAREWQPGGGPRFRAAGDHISLTSRGIESRTKPGTFRGSIQIFYRLAKRAEFDKF